MHTVSLRALQHPSHVDELLTELVQSVDELIPEGAYQILDQSSLPTTLRRLVRYALHTGRSWACWVDDSGHAWLFLAEMTLALSRERGVPVLHVDQYDEEGEIRDTGKWIAAHDGKWQRSSEPTPGAP
jgi:hypothetical protein